jgi:hypothetical protein
MRYFFAIVFLLFSITGATQATYQYGVLPGLNVNKSFSDLWAANFKAESRIMFEEGVFGEEAQFGVKHLLTDISAIAAKKTVSGNTISGGYLARIREEKVTHRLIQQYAIAKRYSGFRLSHRFSADQSFTKDEPTEYRFRYRISAEFPLQGSRVDVNEFYVKMNNEYLNGFEDSQYNLEIRFASVLGYEINNENKVEWGLDYRIDSFLEDASRNRFWMSFNWYLKI